MITYIVIGVILWLDIYSRQDLNLYIHCICIYMYIYFHLTGIDKRQYLLLEPIDNFTD